MNRQKLTRKTIRFQIRWRTCTNMEGQNMYLHGWEKFYVFMSLHFGLFLVFPFLIWVFSAVLMGPKVPFSRQKKLNTNTKPNSIMGNFVSFNMAGKNCSKVEGQSKERMPFKFTIFL